MIIHSLTPIGWGGGRGSRMRSGGVFLACVLLAVGCGSRVEPGSGIDTSAVAVPLPADWALIPEPARQPIREAVEPCRNHPRDPEAFERLAWVYHGNEQTHCRIGTSGNTSSTRWAAHVGHAAAFA